MVLHTFEHKRTPKRLSHTVSLTLHELHIGACTIFCCSSVRPALAQFLLLSFVSLFVVVVVVAVAAIVVVVVIVVTVLSALCNVHTRTTGHLYTCIETSSSTNIPNLDDFCVVSVSGTQEQTAPVHKHQLDVNKYSGLFWCFLWN